MKKLFIMLLSVATLVGCEKTEKSNGLLDINAKFYCSAAEGSILETPTRSGQSILTAKEIVANTNIMRYSNTIESTEFGGYAVTDDIREPDAYRFSFPSYWAVWQDGSLNRDIIKLRNIHFTKERDIDGIWVRDTLAYIPNAVMIDIYTSIIDAVERKDFTECYRILEDGMQFIPCTGAQYKELIASGQR